MADNVNRIRIWKMSHGTTRTNDHLNKGGPDGSRNDLRLKSLITLARKTKQQQGKRFRTEMRFGDFFYLCYGNNVQLLGRVTSGVLDPRKTWVQRRYEILVPEPKRRRFKGPRKKWAPNGNSTCWQVPQGELLDFEKIFLKPFFGLSLRDLPIAVPDGSEAATLPSVLRAVEEEIERGAGFQANSKVRKAVELHAMKQVEKRFRKMGYKVKDVSATQPYDLQCVKEQETRFVEVKGTQGTGSDVFLTAGEVNFIQRNMSNCVLCIVHGISVNNPRKPRTSGGKLEIAEPFDLSKGMLIPLVFRFHRSS